MGIVEALERSLRVEGDTGRDGDLVGLPEVAHVDAPNQRDPILGDALGAQRLDCVGLQAGEQGRDLVGVDLVVAAHPRQHVVVLQVHGEQAEGGDVAR